MDITDIYEAASARGLARSLRHFSSDFLGMVHTYSADTGLARRMGAEAHRAYWQDPPSPEAHASRLLALYETMLSRALGHRREPARLAASL